MEVPKHAKTIKKHGKKNMENRCAMMFLRFACAPTSKVSKVDWLAWSWSQNGTAHSNL
jgi:hypothetical protein